MKKVIIPFLALLPMLASAQDLENVDTLLESIGGLIDTALPIVVGLALLGFFWGLVKFIFAQGNEEGKADAKKIMIWGIIALFVMVAVWGLVAFIGNALDIEQGGAADVPGVEDSTDSGDPSPF